MKELLDAYYEVRRQNETLKGNIKLLQSEIERLKNNAETEATKLNHKVVTPKYNVGGGIVPKWGLVDYEYDTGHVIPRDDSHNWG
jgi:hypothetical protein